MYNDNVKRLQIYIDEELDEQLAKEAVRSRTSKAALIRQAVAERWGRGAQQDAMDDLVGDIKDEGDTGDIDAVVYGA